MNGQCNGQTAFDNNGRLTDRLRHDDHRASSNGKLNNVAVGKDDDGLTIEKRDDGKMDCNAAEIVAQKHTNPDGARPVEETDVPINIVIPPDGGWGWVVVIASFCCNLIVDGIVYSFGTMLNEIAQTFHETKATTSLIGSLQSGTYLIIGPFASALANRYGFRKLTIAGSIISCVSFILSSYATNIQFLFITYGILGGIGFGFIFVPSVIVIGFYFEKWRALATGIAVCGAGIGTFLLAPLTAAVIKYYSWRHALLVQAGLLLSCTIFGAMFRPLQQAMVSVAINSDQEKKQKDQPAANGGSVTKTAVAPLMQAKLANGFGKSESLLNIYQDAGLTITHSTDLCNYFNNNSKYPTVMQIFNLDKRSSLSESLKKSSQSLNNTSGNQQFISDSLGRKSDVSQNKRHYLRYEDGNDSDRSDSNVDRSKEDSAARKTTSKPNENGIGTVDGCLLPEMKILLSRKHSLHSNCKSQSFNEQINRSGAKLNSSVLKNEPARRNTVSKATDLGNRPLYRDDIFFNSSLKRLPQYTSQASGIDYTMTVTRLPTYNDVMEERKSKCRLCPEAVRRVLATMLNISLFQSPTFMVLALSGFATSMGLYVPFIFISDRAMQFGIDTATSVWLLSIIGVANTFGRVGFGILSSITNANALVLNNISLSICGLATMFSSCLPSVHFQYLYAAIFGLSIACFSTLRTIIVVDVLGLEKLTNAFGLLLLFQGIAAVMGSPLAGFFTDLTKNYDTSFYISGTLILLSAVMCYPLGKISRWEHSKKEKTDAPVTNV